MLQSLKKITRTNTRNAHTCTPRRKYNQEIRPSDRVTTNTKICRDLLGGPPSKIHSHSSHCQTITELPTDYPKNNVQEDRVTTNTTNTTNTTHTNKNKDKSCLFLPLPNNHRHCHPHSTTLSKCPHVLKPQDQGEPQHTSTAEESTETIFPTVKPSHYLK